MIRYALESLVFAAIGIWSIWDGFRLSAVSRREGVFDALGPDRYIILIGGILCLLSVIRFLASFSEAQPERGTRETDAPKERAISLRLVLLTLAFAGYALVVPFGGYVLTTALFFAVVYWIMGLRNWARLVSAIVLSTAVFAFVFITLADMPLPRGRLGLPF